MQEYLKNHLDHIVIHRLRTNQPLTATDLLALEQTLVEITAPFWTCMLPQKVLNQSASPITVPLVFVLREIARDQDLSRRNAPTRPRRCSAAPRPLRWRSLRKPAEGFHPPKDLSTSFRFR